MKKEKSYPLDQCHLYKITSPAVLAARLNTSLVELFYIISSDTNYLVRFDTRRGSTKKRLIEEPKPRLQALHGRVHSLLSKVDLPDYVHSIRKGRSYITNAAAHAHEGNMIKLDVKKFYQSAESKSVQSFWSEQMLCREDVSIMLTKLLTYKGHLPTGSRSSPIMSYYTYRTMFDSIADMAIAHGLVPTLYVDDMVISGHGAHAGVLRAARAIIELHGLKSHKHHTFTKARPRIVTGVMVTPTGLLVPHRRNLRIKEAYANLHTAGGVAEKLEVLKILGSLVHEAAQIDPRNRPKAAELDGLRRRLQHEQRTGVTIARNEPVWR